MATSSGTSSGSSSLLRNSSSDDQNLQLKMDQRKRKRMISNRESARRSRMRKQKHLDDLTAQLFQLKNQNHEILNSLNFTSQLCLNLEAENSVLRAQVNELSNRLDSLNEIISYINLCNGFVEDDDDDYFIKQWNCFYVNQPVIDMAIY